MFRFARLARASRCARPLATYASPPGGHPPQSDLLTSRAKFTEAYAMIPRGVLRDIVTSPLPNWERTRSWILARPLSGFAETFSQYVVEVAPGGGSDAPHKSVGKAHHAQCVTFRPLDSSSSTIRGLRVGDR